MPDTQIARGTLTQVLIVGMFEVKDFLGILGATAQSNLFTGVSRAIVDEQKFPIFIGLSENAVDCLLDKLLGIQKNDNNRNQWKIGH